MSGHLRIVLLVAPLIVGVVSPAGGTEHALSAAMTGSQQVPPNASPATGTASLLYNTVTKKFDITVFVTGIPAANVTATHLHEAAVGLNGPVIVDLGTGFTTESGGIRLVRTGVALPVENEASFLTGQTYLNLHTAVVPGGEIRGQLLAGPSVPEPPRIVVSGAGAGGGPHVRVFDAATGAVKFEFFAYGLDFTGGVRVAACDVNGDGVPDIVTGAGPGGGPHVKVFDGVTGTQLSGPIGSFFAFNPAFIGGVHVACSDLNGDGKADVIVGAGAGGGPHVRAFDAVTGLEIPGPLGSFFAYPAGFQGGVFVGGR